MSLQNILVATPLKVCTLMVKVCYMYSTLTCKQRDSQRRLEGITCATTFDDVVQSYGGESNIAVQ